MINLFDKCMLWAVGRKGTSLMVGLYLGVLTVTLVMYVGPWAAFALFLALVSVILLCTMSKWQATVIEWNNSMAREAVAVDMLSQLLTELEESDPDRAHELAVQFVTLSQLAGVSHIEEIGR